MDWLVGVGEWFADPVNWRGPSGVPVLARQHLGYTAAALGLACLVGLPLGLWLGHTRRGDVLAVQAANVGRAVPVYALLVVLVLALGRTPQVALLAFTAFAVPPVLANTVLGVREVDPAVVEAARGTGMSGWQVLLRVELPLAAPLVVAGVRSAAVQVVATVSVAALVAFGGLGAIIVRATGGVGGLDLPEVVAGSLLVAALALAVDGAGALLARRVDPLARSRRRARRAIVTTS